MAEEIENRIDKLKVVLLVFFVFGIILLIGIIGSMPNGYIDADGLEAWFQLHYSLILLVILGVDLILIIGLYYRIRKLIEETMELVLSITLFGIMSYLFLFLNSKSEIMLINRIGDRSDFNIHGVVMNKIVRTNRKRTNHFYSITVTDTLTTRNFYFNVSDFIFKRSHRGEAFNKTFYKGCLGIIYRKEEE